MCIASVYRVPARLLALYSLYVCMFSLVILTAISCTMQGLDKLLRFVWTLLPKRTLLFANHGDGIAQVCHMSAFYRTRRLSATFSSSAQSGTTPLSTPLHTLVMCILNPHFIARKRCIVFARHSFHIICGKDSARAVAIRKVPHYALSIYTNAVHFVSGTKWGLEKIHKKNQYGSLNVIDTV